MTGHALPSRAVGKPKGCSQIGTNRRITLYLIRHGEASHNVLEKAAKAKAKQKALSDGIHDPERLHGLMEEARKAVLDDETLFDANLSPKGLEEALLARDTLESIIQTHELQPPQEVLVSPLTRTLETANAIFPEEDSSIHVREELRERCTGKPCDQRKSSNTLMMRPSFQRFSMNRLREQSVQQNEPIFGEEKDKEEDSLSGDDDDAIGPQSQRVQTDILEENKSMLRRRTRELLPLLVESRHDSICVVTHKGYLRELERGTFGKPEATEFRNCEIRVYTIELACFHDHHSLTVAERLV